MLYLIGAAIAAAVGWFAYGRLRPLLERGEVRIAAGVTSALALGGAAFSASRDAWVKVAILTALGLWMAWLARSPRAAGQTKAGQGREMRAPSSPSLEEARSILGVSAGATPQDIQEAYMRLIRRAHPDAGGTVGLAAQLNAARDRLLEG